MSFRETLFYNIPFKTGLGYQRATQLRKNTP
nr:MAG TPA: hypothetical protein [Caudoviricetes sp.]